MSCHGLTWGAEAAEQKPKAAQRFQEADRVVVEVFHDLHEVRLLKNKPLPEISPGAVQRFERKAWDRLIEYLIRLPLPGDY